MIDQLINTYYYIPEEYDIFRSCFLSNHLLDC